MQSNQVEIEMRPLTSGDKGGRSSATAKGASSAASSAGGGGISQAAGIIVGVALLLFVFGAVMIIVGGVEQSRANDQENKLDDAKSDHKGVMEDIVVITGLPWEDAVTGGRPDACDKKVIIKYDEKHGWD